MSTSTEYINYPISLKNKKPCGMNCEIVIASKKLDNYEYSLSMWYTKLLQIKKKYGKATSEELVELQKRGSVF